MNFVGTLSDCYTACMSPDASAHRPRQPNEMKEVAEEPPDTKTGVGWATECWTEIAAGLGQHRTINDQKTDAAEGRRWELWA